MQELHSAAAAGGRFFGGGGVGDRRLRPQNNQQALKCPRCDSMNTKFCYYNNYNLSQPRHFCKNCRRYWTKGGVLRNVPVGGGCRKSKRSNNNNKSKNNNNNHSSSSETAPATTTPTPQPPPQLPERNSNSHSSSESSSLTAVAAAAATEAISPPTSNAALNNKLFLHENGNNPNFDGGGGDCGVFSEIGTFTNLMTSTNEALAFGFGNNGNFLDATSFRFGGAQSGSDQLPAVPGGGECEWQQQKVLGIGGGDHHNQEFASGPLLLDQTVPVELSSLQSGKTGHGGCGPLDWQHAAGGGADQGLFDLTNAVDQGYWTHTHWSDQDNPTLFHLP